MQLVKYLYPGVLFLTLVVGSLIWMFLLYLALLMGGSSWALLGVFPVMYFTRMTLGSAKYLGQDLDSWIGGRIIEEQRQYIQGLGTPAEKKHPGGEKVG